LKSGEVTGPRSPPHTNIIINQISHVCDNVVSNLQDDVAIFPTRRDRSCYFSANLNSPATPPLQRLPSLDSASFGGDNRGEPEN
jgi:hypothetical protein